MVGNVHMQCRNPTNKKCGIFEFILPRIKFEKKCGIMEFRPFCYNVKEDEWKYKCTRCNFSQYQNK